MQYLSTLNLVGDLTSVRSRGNLKNLNLGFFPLHIATKLGKVLPSGRGSSSKRLSRHRSLTIMVRDVFRTQSNICDPAFVRK